LPEEPMKTTKNLSTPVKIAGLQAGIWTCNLSNRRARYCTEISAQFSEAGRKGKHTVVCA
jgi:hypothetical protein